jgi:hypothetical protein
MALILAIGVWLLLGRFVYRAHKSDRSMRERGNPDYDTVAVSGVRARDEVPDAVPSAWIEAYRAQHGG